MKRVLYTAFLGFATLYMPVSPAIAEAPALTVTVEGIGPGGYIEPTYAFCVPAAGSLHVKDGPDKSVGIAWSKGPEGTKSYAIVMVDTDVPTNFEDAGREGKTIAATMPRKNFYHWILFDIPATKTMIPAYTDSDALVKNGKSVIDTSYGTRGVNDYAPYFATDPERKGVYAGYDGPCPPWNDTLVHHYHFKVFALDVATLGIPGLKATGPAVIQAIKKHTLAEGEVVGKYTLNPSLKP
ncbi:MAG TPA: YbhB/YbcL family Raf kinase inhibitor-like protein [Rickettsiales bacterium]|nr:YbhB/YbcL family Raf kinase inhibitor-like protein [Rickettsiales bacterium]